VSRYLSVDEVIEINAEVVRKFGGIHGLRDSGALQSALGRLESGYYADAIEEAAALFESLSQNHPFLDGKQEDGNHSHWHISSAEWPQAAFR
jgi:death-on-curing protein